MLEDMQQVSELDVEHLRTLARQLVDQGWSNKNLIAPSLHAEEVLELAAVLRDRARAEVDPLKDSGCFSRDGRLKLAYLTVEHAGAARKKLYTKSGAQNHVVYSCDDCGLHHLARRPKRVAGSARARQLNRQHQGGTQ